MTHKFIEFGDIKRFNMAAKDLSTHFKMDVLCRLSKKTAHIHAYRGI